jgi:hypothetical protein
MTTTTIRFSNSNEQPVHVQVDPWAGVYRLAKGEEIEILAESETNSPAFQVDEYKDTRILTILHSTEYFIVKDGKRIHWTEYQSNM